MKEGYVNESIHVKSDYIKYGSKNPGPKMSPSEQNQQWELKRPDARWTAIAMSRWKQYHNSHIKSHQYNRKYTNNLTSHSGESRVSRADKMSGMSEGEKKYMQGSSKKFIKEFYSSKRRMFLKNENNWDKI